MSARAAVSDRFYRALCRCCFTRRAAVPPRRGSALSLTYRALKDDPRPARAAAIVKRLLQVASHAPAPFACGSLMLVSELLSTTLHWERSSAAEGEDGDDVERFVDEDDSDDENATAAATKRTKRRTRRPTTTRTTTSQRSRIGL